MRRSALACVLFVAVGGGWPAPVLAQDVPGTAPTGLPGIFRVGVPGEVEPGLAVAGTAGYGLTEAQDGEDGSHHRIGGIVGFGVTPTPWLGLSLRLDGRYDTHPDDEVGSDDGFVGAPTLLVRAGSNFGSLRLGAELGWTVPGEDAPSFAVGASVLDASVLAAFAPEDDGLVVALRAGYRLDGSGDAIDEPDRLRSGDRLALGLSDFDAILLGAGVSWRTGAVEVLGEATWDLLVGEDAPSPSRSPIRLTAGARWHANDSLALEILGEVSPSRRPEVAGNLPLVPVEPRAAVWLGVRWNMPFSEPPAAGGSLEDPAADADAEAEAPADAPAQVEQPTEPETPAEPEEPALPPGQIRGLVRSFTGEPLQARVVVEPLGTEVQTDADGMFTVDVPPGQYEVRIQAPQHGEQVRRVTVEENGVTILNADLRRSR